MIKDDQTLSHLVLIFSLCVASSLRRFEHYVPPAAVACNLFLCALWHFSSFVIQASFRVRVTPFQTFGDGLIAICVDENIFYSQRVADDHKQHALKK